MTVAQQRVLAALAMGKDPFAYLRLGAEWLGRDETLAIVVGQGWVKRHRGEYQMTALGRQVYNQEG